MADDNLVDDDARKPHKHLTVSSQEGISPFDRSTKNRNIYNQDDAEKDSSDHCCFSKTNQATLGDGPDLITNKPVNPERIATCIDSRGEMLDHNNLESFSPNEPSCFNCQFTIHTNNGIHPLSPCSIATTANDYEKLKERYQILQNDYQSSLEREKALCGKLNVYSGQDDECFNSLTNLNTELRNELDFVLGEMQILKKENKRLQEESRCNRDKEVAATPCYQERTEITKLEEVVKLEKLVLKLETECKQLQEEKDNAKEKLAAHDVAAKRAIVALQKEMKNRMESLEKEKEDLLKEKDTLVLKYAKFEHVLERQKEKIDQLEKKLAEYEQDDELSKLQDEFEKVKTEHAAQTVKLKWAENKLKKELEAHKDTKAKLAQTNAKLEEVKEEGEEIRSACQKMIAKYQDSEEMRSVQLDKAVKEKESTIKVQEHEIAIQNEIDRKKSKELEVIKSELRNALAEISDLKSTKSMLEQKLNTFKIKDGDMEKRISTLTEKEEEWALTRKMLDDANEDLKRCEDRLSCYEQLEDQLKKQLSDAEYESNELKKREAELLSFIEKLSANNAHWKSQTCDLQCRFDNAEAQALELHEMIQKSNLESTNQEAIARKQKEEFQMTLADLARQIQHKEKLFEELALNFEEAQDEIKVQKRKTASTIKDLQRQLHQSKKRVDQLEESLSNCQDSGFIKTRASSNSSLDRLSNDSGAQMLVSAPPIDQNVTNISNPALQSNNYHSCDGEYSIVQPNKTKGPVVEFEVDKAVLIDRICRLQKAHAKKNEKLEFLEEHNRSLLEDIKKKNRLLQYYVLREESGTLISSSFDRNKAEISKKGGIMASIFSSQVSDKDMTLDLSLEINRKLQAVLEDTLLKNITLKDSINTLGAEISQLQDDMKRARK